jgi:hypothetical protein
MKCSVCGNTYDRLMEITISGSGPRLFDSFECAIQALAPTCPHCGVRVVGHGVETADRTIYCCAHCARQEGHAGMADHQPQSVVSGEGMRGETPGEEESAVSGSGRPSH